MLAPGPQRLISSTPLSFICVDCEQYPLRLALAAVINARGDTIKLAAGSDLMSVTKRPLLCINCNLYLDSCGRRTVYPATASISPCRHRIGPLMGACNCSTRLYLAAMHYLGTNKHACTCPTAIHVRFVALKRGVGRSWFDSNRHIDGSAWWQTDVWVPDHGYNPLQEQSSPPLVPERAVE